MSKKFEQAWISLVHEVQVKRMCPEQILINLGEKNVG